MAELGTPRRRLAETASTMAEARRWAARGAPHGALVVADHQTDGRGRHGRAWLAAPGESLLCTLVLRPRLDPARLGWVALAAGLAVAESLDAHGVRAHVKWPNDVRVGGRKVAGVLAESVHHPAGVVLLLGIGLNVRQAGFPDALQATSVRLETGRDLDPQTLLPALLDALSARLGHVAEAPDALRRAVAERLETATGAVSVSDPATSEVIARGEMLGLAADGALRLRTPHGERSVYAGEVTLSL